MENYHVRFHLKFQGCIAQIVWPFVAFSMQIGWFILSWLCFNRYSNLPIPASHSFYVCWCLCSSESNMCLSGVIQSWKRHPAVLWLACPHDVRSYHTCAPCGWPPATGGFRTPSSSEGPVTHLLRTLADLDTASEMNSNWILSGNQGNHKGP